MGIGGVEMGLDHEAELRRDEDGNIIRDADNVPMADSNGQHERGSRRRYYWDFWPCL